MSAPRAVFVALLAAVLALAGCMEKPLSEEQAAERAETALSAFASSMTRESDGDIKRLSGTMSMSGEDAEIDFGLTDMEMEIVWGQDGIIRLTIGADSGGFTMEIVAYCTPTQTLFEWGDEVYASRAAPASAGSDDLCHGMGEEEFNDAGSLFTSEEFAALDQQEVTTSSDGSITAVYRDPGDGSTYTFTIDRKGRIVRMVLAGPAGDGAFDMEYGGRERLNVPTPTARIATNAYFSSSFESGTLTAQITDSTEQPPLDELEVHVTETDWESGDRNVIASFPLATPTASSNGWSFSFNDADADGRLTSGDTFTVQNSGWDSEWDYEIEIFDTWADSYANENPVPAPGIALLLGALVVGIAFLARRRRA